ncbi:RHS repeat-associated core domain-containing protein [Pseudomonas faucium]|uniref:RHS repeat-associated core domain-containing protein n=1 Tax=Pseudomonas faucium TaxID=2740518 RepID=UPI001596CB69|nr:RHS repeat-associated core domain-containing protein [Pseudomonas faucium]
MSKSLSNTQFFYQGDKLITVKHGDQHRAIFRNAAMPLAEVQAGEASSAGLLATDDKGSVLQVASEEEEEPHAYSSYGHDPTLPSPLTLLGFNGERYDHAITGSLLGNGYRGFNSTLMRFCAPDSWGPFSVAGLNTYCYCLGDPVNHVDPSGHIRLPMLAKAITKFLGLRQRPLPFTGTNAMMVIVSSLPRPSRQRMPVAPSPRPVTAPHSSIQAPQQALREPAPIQLPRQPLQGTVPRARRYSSDSSMSTDASTDSTPTGSRAASPTLPDFVQHALDLRSSAYYSRRFDY